MVLALASVWLGACGEDASGRNGDGQPVIVNQGECSPNYLTASCTCASQGNIPGRQTCLGGKWGECACKAVAPSTAGTGGFAGTGAAGTDGTAGTGAAGTDGTAGVGLINDPPGNRSTNRFEWKQTPFELGSCKAGHYVGTFAGFYGSPIIWTAPVPVVAAPGVDGAPGLEFTLTKIPGSGELFSIDGGKMRGTANGLFPFTADLKGTLDCSTKKYVGTIENGEYDVFGMKYQFIGTMTADYPDQTPPGHTATAALIAGWCW